MLILESPALGLPAHNASRLDLYFTFSFEMYSHHLRMGLQGIVHVTSDQSCGCAPDISKEKASSLQESTRFGRFPLHHRSRPAHAHLPAWPALNRGWSQAIEHCGCKYHCSAKHKEQVGYEIPN